MSVCPLRGNHQPRVLAGLGDFGRCYPLPPQMDGGVAENGRRLVGGGVDICHTHPKPLRNNPARKRRDFDSLRGETPARKNNAAIYKSWMYINLSFIYKTYLYIYLSFIYLSIIYKYTTSRPTFGSRGGGKDGGGFSVCLLLKIIDIQNTPMRLIGSAGRPSGFSPPILHCDLPAGSIPAVGAISRYNGVLILSCFLI